MPRVSCLTNPAGALATTRRSSRRHCPGCSVVLTRPLPPLRTTSVPVSQEADERSALHATASRDAAADQKARYVALHIGALVAIVLDFVLVVVVPGLAAILQQFGQERATHAPPPKDTAGDQEAHELALAIVALLADVLVAL